MGFGSSKKKSHQLTKKLLLQLPYTPVCNGTDVMVPTEESDESLEDTILRRSENDASPPDSGEGSSSNPMPQMASPVSHNVFDGAANNLDDVLFSTNIPPFAASSLSSLPHLEPKSCQDHPFARSLPSRRAGSSESTASYRWYMMMEHPPVSKDFTTPKNDDVLEPFFSFGTASESGSYEDEYHGDDECEENVSLLHGGSKGIGNSSSPMIPNIFKIPKSQTSLSDSSFSFLWGSNTTSTSNPAEDSISLMTKSNDWSERQLAFDLDSVVEDEEDDDNGSFENTLWMLQLEEDDIQSVPPPPLVLSHDATKKMSLPENKLCKSSQSRDCYYDGNDRLHSHLGKEKLSNESLVAEFQNRARVRKGSRKRRSTRQSYPSSRSSKKMPSNKTTRYTAKLTGSRRYRRRRSWCAGRDFAPNLSTVAEQSEEDEGVPEEDDLSTSSAATLETASGSLEFFEAEGGNLYSC